MNFLENWKEEKRSAYLYLALCAIEKNPVHKKLFLDLSVIANKQADIWEKQIKAARLKVPLDYQPDFHVRLMIKLVQCFGVRALRTALAAMKIRGMSIYNAPLLGTPEKPIPDTISSGKIFPDKAISDTVSSNKAFSDKSIPDTPSSTKIFSDKATSNKRSPDITLPNKASIEQKHNTIRYGNNIRAAVFGVNDGLVSNASLIFGIMGAGVLSSHMILLTGISGLFAGACSMAAGEYVSVRSQREMLEYQLALEKSELALYPEEEAAELAYIYQARGLPKEEAERMAYVIIQNPEKALDTLAREELGINPQDLISPWGAAISSFLSFSLGALVPLLPFIFNHLQHRLSITIFFTGLTLFFVGAILSLFTQRNALWSGLRMLLIGTGAGAFTYLIGHMIGISV